MTRFHLSPLPGVRFNEASGVPVLEEECFVDDSVVMALLAGRVTERAIPISAEFALTTHEMDFAGWHLLTPAAATARPPQQQPPLPQPPHCDPQLQFSKNPSLASRSTAIIIANVSQD